MTSSDGELTVKVTNDIQTELKPLEERDLTELLKGLSGELIFKKDAIKYLLKKTSGNTRKLIIALGIIEKVARVNDLKELSRKELIQILEKKLRRLI